MPGNVYAATPAVRPVDKQEAARQQDPARPERAFAELLAEAEAVQDAVRLSAKVPELGGTLAGLPGAGFLHGLTMSPWLGGMFRKPREERPEASEDDER